MNSLWNILKFMWYWPNWIGNISADIIVAVLVSLLWPQLRRAIGKWFDAKMHAHLNNHHESIKKHIDEHMHKVHKKLDEQ